jgi:hypothetical protein
MEASKKKRIAVALMAVIMLLLGGSTFVLAQELDRAKNMLTAKDAQIQQLDTKLGISESTLLGVSELNKKYKDEIDAFPDKLKGIIDSYELKIQSRDRTIASLRNTIDGGTTVVEIISPPGSGGGADGASISYKWTDKLDRFHLVDPDIFIENNEKFTYNQHVAVKGHVLYGKDGKLQIRRVEIQEVVPDGTGEDGKPAFKPVPGGEMTVVDSTFEYADLGSKERNLWDIIHPRLLASMDSQLKISSVSTEIRPGIGVEVLNLGRYIDHANIGLNTKVTLNLDDPLGGSLLKSRVGAGIGYTFAPPILNTNFALGVSASTPSNNLLNEWHFTVDAIFFVTN